MQNRNKILILIIGIGCFALIYHFLALRNQEITISKDPAGYLKDANISFSISFSDGSRNETGFIDLNDAKPYLPLAYNGIVSEIAIKENFFAKEDPLTKIVNFYVPKKVGEIDVNVQMIQLFFDAWDGNYEKEYYEDTDGVFDFTLSRLNNNQVENSYDLEIYEPVTLKENNSIDKYRMEIFMVDKLVFKKDININWLPDIQFLVLQEQMLESTLASNPGRLIDVYVSSPYDTPPSEYISITNKTAKIPGFIKKITLNCKYTMADEEYAMPLNLDVNLNNGEEKSYNYNLFDDETMKSIRHLNCDEILEVEYDSGQNIEHPMK